MPPLRMRRRDGAVSGGGRGRSRVVAARAPGWGGSAAGTLARVPAAGWGAARAPAAGAAVQRPSRSRPEGSQVSGRGHAPARRDRHGDGDREVFVCLGPGPGQEMPFTVRVRQFQLFPC